MKVEAVALNLRPVEVFNLGAHFAGSMTASPHRSCTTALGRGRLVGQCTTTENDG